jgi:RNA polymerase sigma-70 factor, ECF subfamily
LPEGYRTVVTLSELEGVPLKEISQRLGIGLSAIKSRVQRGRRQLRRNLARCCEIQIEHGRIVGCEVRNPRGCRCGPH